jgi:hypothetical protein
MLKKTLQTVNNFNMKLTIIYLVLFLSTAIYGCQNQNKQQTSAADSTLFKDTTPAPEKDPRPNSEVAFLNRVKAEADFDSASDAVKKDAHIAAFNKYTLDSLKNISDWEMIVAEINDNELSSNSVMKKIGLAGPVYNIILKAPIKIDKSVDSIAITNRVEFTYTIPKQPKGDALKKQLEIIKTLSKGDVVVVSGAITHFDDSGKVDFTSFYDEYVPWNVDLLLNDISKSPINHYTFLKK